MIHPTAVIDPVAELAPDVEVGPYVIIEGKVRVGPGCKILGHAVLTGSVTLGAGNTVGYGAVIGAPPQDLSFKPETDSGVVIGDRNTIREYCTIHRGTNPGSLTTVGNDNFFMAGVHLAHNVSVGNRTILANNVLLAGHVHVEDGVFIGGGSVFHQFLRIGQLAVTQGLSAFSKDIPPFVMAADRNGIIGLNVVGLRRAGLKPAERAEIKEAFRLLYRSGLNISQAVEKAREKEWGVYGKAFFDFASAPSKRGLCEGSDSTKILEEGLRG